MSAQVSKKQQKNTQLVNENQKTAIITQVAESQFIGPIPPPEILSGYESIQAGFADRILTMAENQSKHRQKQEADLLKCKSRDSLLGIIFAFVICISFIGAGVFVSVNAPNGTIPGAFLSTIGIGSIITSFIKTTRTNNKDKE